MLDHGVKAEDLSILFPEGYNSAGRDKLEDAEHSEGTVKGGITTTTAEDAGAGAVKGAGIGLVAGTLAALAAITLPGVGLVIGGGALAMALGGMAGTAAAGAVAGGATGFLKDQGVPADVTENYENVIRGGGALVVVSPTGNYLDLAEVDSILTKYNGVVSSYMPGGSAVVKGIDYARVDDDTRVNPDATIR